MAFDLRISSTTFAFHPFLRSTNVRMPFDCFAGGLSLCSDLGCTVANRILNWCSILVGVFESKVLFQYLDVVDTLESGCYLMAVPRE